MLKQQQLKILIGQGLFDLLSHSCMMYRSCRQRSHHRFILHQQICGIFLLGSFFQVQCQFSSVCWWYLVGWPLVSAASTSSIASMGVALACFVSVAVISAQYFHGHFVFSLEMVACKHTATLCHHLVTLLRADTFRDGQRSSEWIDGFLWFQSSRAL